MNIEKSSPKKEAIILARSLEAQKYKSLQTLSFELGSVLGGRPDLKLFDELLTILLEQQPHLKIQKVPYMGTFCDEEAQGVLIKALVTFYQTEMFNKRIGLQKAGKLKQHFTALFPEEASPE